MCPSSQQTIGYCLYNISNLLLMVERENGTNVTVVCVIATAYVSTVQLDLNFKNACVCNCTRTARA